MNTVDWIALATDTAANIQRLGQGLDSAKNNASEQEEERIQELLNELDIGAAVEKAGEGEVDPNEEMNGGSHRRVRRATMKSKRLLHHHRGRKTRARARRVNKS